MPLQGNLQIVVIFAYLPVRHKKTFGQDIYTEIVTNVCPVDIEKPQLTFTATTPSWDRTSWKWSGLG